MIANDDDIATSLFVTALKSIPEGSIVFGDVPNKSPPSEWGSRIMKNKNWELARMYTKSEPSIQHEHIYISTTAELG